MSKIKISELATSAISLDDFIIKANPEGLATKSTIRDISDLLTASSDLAFNGSISASETPSENGWYFASESGTYANLGGMVIDTSDNIVIVIISGTYNVFNKIDVPVSVNIDSTPTLGSTNAVESGGVNTILNLKTDKDKTEFDFIEFNNTGYSNGSLNVGDVFNGSTFSISSLNCGAIDCVENDELYLKVMGASSARAWCFVNSSDEIISYAVANADLYNAPQIITAPSNAVKCYVNHKNSNPFGFAVILNELSKKILSDINLSATISDLNTEETSRIDADAILQQEVDRNEDNIAGIVNANNAISLYDGYYADFNGSTSNFILSDEYSLSVDGDYFEIVSKWSGSVSSEGLGLIGKGSANTNNLFGYYNSNQIWFKDETSGYLKVLSLSGLDEFHKLKLIVVNSNTEWEVFKDDVSVGTFAKSDDFKIKQLGNAYTTNAKVSIKSLKINTSVLSLDLPNVFISNETKTDLTLKTDTIDVSNFSKCYLSYNPTGSLTGTEQFKAYVQVYGFDKTVYFAFEIAKDYDLADLVYTNQYRIQRCEICTFDGILMTEINERALMSGESEFAYKHAGKDDFTGGWHGDEILTEVNFYVDKVRLTSSELSSAFDLLPCDEFLYIQKSNLTETAESGVPNLSHPTEALHDKYTSFGDSSYEVRNRITWQQNIADVYAHLSISTLSTYLGEYAQTDKYNIATFDRLGNRKIEGINDNAHIWNETNGFSVDILSEFDTYNNSSNQYISDASSNNKYYRRTGNVAVTNGEEWNSKTIYKFRNK